MTKMNTFGTIKSKLVKKLTESYISDKKSEIKEIVNIIRRDKEFRDLYLFYEEIENKYIDDPSIAKLKVTWTALRPHPLIEALHNSECPGCYCSVPIANAINP